MICPEGQRQGICPEIMSIVGQQRMEVGLPKIFFHIKAVSSSFQGSYGTKNAVVAYIGKINLSYIETFWRRHPALFFADKKPVVIVVAVPVIPEMVPGH